MGKRRAAAVSERRAIEDNMDDKECKRPALSMLIVRGLNKSFVEDAAAE